MFVLALRNIVAARVPIILIIPYLALYFDVRSTGTKMVFQKGSTCLNSGVYLIGESF
jgi:hypothetical protein